MTATVHPINAQAEPSLEPLMQLVADDMNGVNAVILERMQSKVALITELAGHLIAGGGKRMRPMLTLACANLLGYPGTRHHKLAAAVEFIHTATLLHDDVVDGSGMRRGKRTANLIWVNSASVLVGDFLFSRAFELMVEDGSLKVLRILSHASAVIAEGEVDQLTGRRNPSLDPLVTLTQSGMNGVNSVILERMQSKVALIPELAGHLIAGGGKRMRPMLTLACASLLGYPGTRHHKLAAAVEFIHTATLLHDDVVDGSGMRRGKRTANLIWGNSASVLVGDFLFSRAFELMVEDGSLKVLKILSSASCIIAEGEVEQLTAQRRIETDEEQYLAIIGAKTAALFAAACRVAPVVAEADEEAELALESYGRNLGIAFQLADDVIDYASDAETMGKGVGDDFRDGKMTLPLILAYARGSEADRAFWRAAVSGERISDHDLAHAIQLMRSTGALSDTIECARQYGRRAIDSLANFRAGKAKSALTEAVEFAIARAY